ncbi:hypothetical protein BJV78DRAFT_1290193 [Lactifluus subvellereus]|nr:hypothetical protein BJV78DRAFT_1290193 [Lactifluus subvellereus]
MSFPSPTEAPAAFADYLKASNLDAFLELFSHCQNKPAELSDGRLDETRAMEWCRKMDSYFAQVGRALNAYPQHADVLRALNDLCVAVVTPVENKLERQKAADIAAEKQQEAEERDRLEERRLNAEWADKERQERIRELDEIEASQRKLAQKKKVLLESVKIVDIGDDNDDDNEIEDEIDDNGSESAPAGPSTQLTKRQLDQEARAKLPQITHTQFTRPIALPALHAEKRKMCRTRQAGVSPPGQEVVVKEEPKSPAPPAPRKRKARPSTDATTAWTVEKPDDDASTSTQSLGKWPRTDASTTSSVRFEGIVIPTLKPPRRSTRVTKANPKKELDSALRRFSQELATASRTAEEVADLMLLE